MLKQEIFSGEYIIVYSGSALMYDYNSNFCISFNGNLDEKITIHITFIDDEVNTEARAKTRYEKNEVFIESINFNSALGTGVVEPIELFKVDGKNTYFRYWVKNMGNKTTREVLYTIYMDNINE